MNATTPEEAMDTRTSCSCCGARTGIGYICHLATCVHTTFCSSCGVRTDLNDTYHLPRCVRANQPSTRSPPSYNSMESAASKVSQCRDPDHKKMYEKFIKMDEETFRQEVPSVWNRLFNVTLNARHFPDECERALKSLNNMKKTNQCFPVCEWRMQ